MESPTNDPSISPLKRLITSTPPVENTANSSGLGKNNRRLVPLGLSDIANKFANYYYSCTKIPFSLLQEVVADSTFDLLATDVLNNPIFKEFPVKNSFRRQVLKELTEKVEQEHSDSTYEALAACIVDQSEYSYRLYTTSSGYLLCAIRESNQQLCHGTTGLSVWQASCDLAHFLTNYVNLDGTSLIELGAGCGLAGIAAASFSSQCTVTLTDYDPKVLAQLELNIGANFEEGDRKRIRVTHLDWCNWRSEDLCLDGGIDIVIASDVVYDRALLPSLCQVLYNLLEKKGSFALIASTLRDPDTQKNFRAEIGKQNLLIRDEVQYYRETFEFADGSRLKSRRSFPFYSTLDTPTVFLYLVRSC